MQAQFSRFGEVELEGAQYTEDVVIVKGKVRLRNKDASRPLKAGYGHTPLSEREDIPWDCSRLIIGTGANGKLPITDEVRSTAQRRGVELIAVPTEQACALLRVADLATTNAILHLTC